MNIIGARKTTETTIATKGCRSAIKIQMQADGTPKPIQIAATVLRSRIACRFSILKNVHLRRDAIKVALSINLHRQRYAKPRATGGNAEGKYWVAYNMKVLGVRLAFARLGTRVGLLAASYFAIDCCSTCEELLAE